MLYVFAWRLQSLLSEEEFTDVTLVSDDIVAFKAQKFILSTCSPVMQDLLTGK